MIGSWALKARVEENLGVALAPDFFDKAEKYARRKLDLCNERAGRQYGEDGYGDEYLVLLTADTVREMAFSEYTMIRSAEIMARSGRRRKGGGSMRRRKPSLPKWKYAFSCRDCRHVQFIKDEAKGREGDYCVKSIERADAGLPGPIHADEADRVVRCDCYEPIPKEGDPA